MNSILKIILIFIFITNCSLTKNTKFWSKDEVEKEKKEIIKQDNIEVIFKKKKIINLEFNPDLKINVYSKLINKSFLNNLDNNNGRVNYNGKLKNTSKFKFSKIDKLYDYNPEILFYKNDIIFFDNKGSILKFNSNSNLIWKKNYYSKFEKNQRPILFFANNDNVLIVTDNIAKYYALDIITGKLLWTKQNKAPFNSQIKIYKDSFFVIDFKNTLRAYSIDNGKELWNIKTESSLIRSQKKLSMVIVDGKIYFNNSLGDISSVDIKSGELIWQNPTQSSLIHDEGFFLKTSDIIAEKRTLYFSNNKNKFFSMDSKTGILNWHQDINSNLRPTIIDKYIFTVTNEGYLVVIDKNSGNIIRITDVFKNIKPKVRLKVKPKGFIVGKNNIYLTTNHGKLFVIDITSGQTKSIIKIDKKSVSRPAVINENLYIITDKSIIKFN